MFDYLFRDFVEELADAKSVAQIDDAFGRKDGIEDIYRNTDFLSRSEYDALYLLRQTLVRLYKKIA